MTDPIEAGLHSNRSSRSAKSAALVVALFAFGMTAARAADVVTLPEGCPFPESVAATADGALYVSSITDGGVVRAAPGATTAETFIKPGDFDTRSTFGVLADEKAGMLWVGSNDASPIGLKGPSAVEGAWLKGFDLKTGEGKVSVRLPGEAAVANDFAIGTDGSVYVTNTLAPQILRLKPGASALEVFVQDDMLKGGLDGIAFGEDGDLYVNTYMGGGFFRIAVKDGAAGEVTKLKTSRPLTLPDGLKPVAGGFVMVEGAGPLSRVTVSGDEAKIETIAEFAGPTGVAVLDGAAWVAEGQLDYLTDPAKAGQRPAAFELRRTQLPGG